jgi:hypothetical protein
VDPLEQPKRAQSSSAYVAAMDEFKASQLRRSGADMVDEDVASEDLVTEDEPGLVVHVLFSSLCCILLNVSHYVTFFYWPENTIYITATSLCIITA